MPSIRREVVVDASIETAWTRLRDVGGVHTLFAPVLTASRLDGDVRTVVFANGMELREQILDVDETHHRVAYAVLESPMLAYHHASMQLDMAGPGRCLFVWITDALPAAAIDAIAPLIEQGTAAFKRNVEEGSTQPSR